MFDHNVRHVCRPHQWAEIRDAYPARTGGHVRQRAWGRRGGCQSMHQDSKAIGTWIKQSLSAWRRRTRPCRELLRALLPYASRRVSRPNWAKSSARTR
jgi:hypothetical protein